MRSGPECVVAVLVGCLTMQSWSTMAQLHEQGFQAVYHGMPKDGCLPALQWPPLLRSSCCPEAPRSPIAPVHLYAGLTGIAVQSPHTGRVCAGHEHRRV